MKPIPTTAALVLLGACQTQPAPLGDRVAQDRAEDLRASTLQDLSTTETELRSSDITVGDYFGSAVWGMGDIDGDGYDDVAVGAMSDDDGASSGGAVYVYLGSATGLDSTTEVELFPSDGAGGDLVGRYLGGAGDFDGDGYRDLLLSSPTHDHSLSNDGAAWVFYGSSTGIDGSVEQELTHSSPALHDAFGSAVASAGDVDGDGFDDVIISASGADDSYTDSGAAFVYLGSSTGVDLSTETTIAVSAGDSTAAFGGTLLGELDLDDDGYEDVVIGTPTGYSGSVWIYLGSATGIDPSSGTGLTPSDHHIVGFASSLAAADFDGDGHDDLAIGARGDDTAGGSTNTGAVYLYLGASTGVDASSEVKWTTSDVGTRDAVGGNLAAGSDLDADGLPELLVGVSAHDHSGYTDAGSVYVYYGSSTGLSTASEDKLTASSPADEDYLGGVAAVGDVDGDGFDDLAAGMRGQDSPPNGGSVLVWTGMCRDADGDGLCVEDDCDDDDSSVGEADTWYEDADSDGYPDASSSTEDCDQPSGFLSEPSSSADWDCDDTDAAIHPGATEVCDAANTDEDCSGDADDDDTSVDTSTWSTWFTDADSDTYGDAASPVSQCDQPAGTVTDDTDCDDTDPFVNPGELEVCDAANTDEDCSGEADDDDPEATGKETVYTDADGDSFGDPETASTWCDAPADTTVDASDCDDTDPAVNPAAAEVPGDGVDQDCDGSDLDSPDDSEGKGSCSSMGSGPSTPWLLALVGLACLRRRRAQTSAPRNLGGTGGPQGMQPVEPSKSSP